MSDNSESGIDPVPINRKSNNRIRRKMTSKPIEKRMNELSDDLNLSFVLVIVLEISMGG